MMTRGRAPRRGRRPDPSFLTVNGYTLRPLFEVDFRGASAAVCPNRYGQALSLENNGTDMTLSAAYSKWSPKALKAFSGGDRFIGTGALAPGTSGLITEYVGATNAQGTVASSRNAGNAYELLLASGPSFNMYTGDGSTAVSCVSGTIDSVTLPSVLHAMCFINYNENSTAGGLWFVNGVQSGTGVNCSAITGADVATDDTWTIGGRSWSTSGSYALMGFCGLRIWATNNLASGDQSAAYLQIAKQRHLMTV